MEALKYHGNFEQMSDCCWAHSHEDGKPRCYVKVRSDVGCEGYGEVDQEYSSYQKLKGHLQMPQVKMISDNGSPLLVVKSVEGRPISESMKDKPRRSVFALKELVMDIFKMWDETNVEMNEKELPRNMRLTNLETLKMVKDDPECRELLDKPLTINGEEYPSIKSTIDKCQKKMEEGKDSTMVLSHGDEQYENIFINGKSYWLIDPRMAGYYPPAQVFSCLVGGAYLFFNDYEVEVEEDKSRLKINYQLDQESKKTHDGFRDQLARLAEKIEEIDETSLYKEYLFTNMSRVLIGRFNPKRKEIAQKNKFAHLGIATEIYYRGL